MLGAIAANLLPGDPIDRAVVLQHQNRIAQRHLGPAACDPGGHGDPIIGNPDKQKDKDAPGGLLRQIDGFGPVLGRARITSDPFPAEVAS